VNAQQRIDDALQVALDVLFAAQDAGEITVGDAAQIVDIVGAALRTVRAWAPEWETSNG
jgi:hypothetical protein